MNQLKDKPHLAGLIQTYRGIVEETQKAQADTKQLYSQAIMDQFVANIKTWLTEKLADEFEWGEINLEWKNNQSWSISRPFKIGEVSGYLMGGSVATDPQYSRWIDHLPRLYFEIPYADGSNRTNTIHCDLPFEAGRLNDFAEPFNRIILATSTGKVDRSIIRCINEAIELFEKAKKAKADWERERAEQAYSTAKYRMLQVVTKDELEKVWAELMKSYPNRITDMVGVFDQALAQIKGWEEEDNKNRLAQEAGEKADAACIDIISKTFVPHKIFKISIYAGNDEEGEPVIEEIYSIRDQPDLVTNKWPQLLKGEIIPTRIFNPFKVEDCEIWDWMKVPAKAYHWETVTATVDKHTSNRRFPWFKDGIIPTNLILLNPF